MVRTRLRLIVAIVGLLLATGLVTVGVAQTDEDPRNASDEYYDAVNGARCYEHHGAEGFVALDYALVTRYSQLPIGEAVDLIVRVGTQSSALPHELHSIAVALDLSDAPNVDVVGQDPREDIAGSEILSVHHGDTGRVGFEVDEGVGELYVSAQILDPGPVPPDSGQGDRLTLRLVGANGETDVVGGGTHASMRRDPHTLPDFGYGPYGVEVEWDAADAMLPGSTTREIQIDLFVNHTSSRVYTFRPPEGHLIRPGDPPVDIVMPVTIRSEEPGHLDLRVQAVASWIHTPSDGAVRDDGLYYRFLTMDVRGGETLLEAPGTDAPIPASGPLVLMAVLGGVAVAARMLPRRAQTPTDCP